MKNLFRRLWRFALPVSILGLALLAAMPARAQGTITFPTWMEDSAAIQNRYLLLWAYFRNNDVTRWNLWTTGGDPQNPGDDFRFFETIDAQGNSTIVWPWGSRLFSGMRPTRRIGNAGDDRPFANVLTLRIEDPASATGFSHFQFLEDSTELLSPNVVPIQQAQGFFSPRRIVQGNPAQGGIDVEVTQRLEFARDLLRVETVITNNTGSSRRIGARLLIDCFVDFWGPTRSFFFPERRERLLFERDFRGAQVPREWIMFDDDEGGSPNYIAKGILRGNDATDPSRVVFGNTLDMFPFALADPDTNYDWTVRPDFELRIADMGTLIYWDPIPVPGGQTRSFVTYVGMGVADHGMSDAYTLTRPTPLYGQGFVGAVQTPFAVPLIDADADTSTFAATAYMQSASDASMPSSFAFIDIPEGLKFADNNPGQSLRLDLGSVAPAGSGNLDEATDDWTLQPDGVTAGLLPVTVTFGNAFQDTARVVRLVNVPQGRLYQLGFEWRMLTFPFTYGGLQDDPATVLGLAPGSFAIVRYNPQQNIYEQVSRIEPGVAYWVRLTTLNPGQTAMIRLSADAQPVRLGITDPTGTQTLFTVGMRTGWNQVGNPSPYAIPVRDLEFFTFGQFGGARIGFDQAVSLNWIRPGIFEYNPKTNQYVQLTKDSVIQPGKGLWVFSSGERFIAFPAPEGPGLSIQTTAGTGTTTP